MRDVHFKWAKYTSLTVVILIAGLAISRPAQAAPIVYEPFLYPSDIGNDVAGLGSPYTNGSPGFNGSVWRDGNSGTEAQFTVSGTNLTYTNGTPLDTLGGSIVESDTSNPSLYFRNFDMPAGFLNTGNQIYFSFLTSVPDDGSRTFGLVTSDTNFGLRIYRVNPSGTGKWQLQIGGNSDLTDVDTNGFTGLVLGRITMLDGPDNVEIWFNPDISSEAALGTPDGALLGIANTPNFNRFRLEGGNFPSDLTFDELRIADNFRDAVPVPEPATAGLIGLASLVLLRRRRAG